MEENKNHGEIIVQCEGTTKENLRCNNNSLEDQKYCFRHLSSWFDKFTYFIADFLGIKRKFLWWLVIFGIILYFIQVYAGYKFDRMIDAFEKKPNVDAYILPFAQREPWGDYLPLVILNSGDLPLYNLTTLIKSCVMIGSNTPPEKHQIPVLLPNNQYIVRFGNKNTIIDFERQWCAPSSDYPSPSISIAPQLNETKSSITTTCGYCNYEIYIQSDKINKTIKGFYRAPVDVEIKIIPIK